MAKKNEGPDLFNQLKESILNIDPVYWIENNLTIDGKKFDLSSGWKPFADIYRYVCTKALEKDAKPLIICKSRQTGGTVMGNVTELYLLSSGNHGVKNPPMRIIHAFPQIGMANGYSKTKFTSMVESSRIIEDPLTRKKIPFIRSKMVHSKNDSISLKDFENGNHIWLESTGLTGDRLRSKTADLILFDEMQDLTAEAISNSRKILIQSQYGPPGIGVAVFFGTPKRMGSPFHRMWQESSQNYFHLGCEKCKKTFPLYTPGSDKWEEIYIHTFVVKCTHCGHEQDKVQAVSRGKWVETRPNEDKDVKYIGYHINQLYMPTIPKENVTAFKPSLNSSASNREYQNEVMGEFYNGDSTPISREEIQEACGEREFEFLNYLEPSSTTGKRTVIGIDFGQMSDLEKKADPSKKQGASFTIAVVLTEMEGILTRVTYAVKFKKNDMLYKKAVIHELFRRFSADLIVGDIGDAWDFSQELQGIYGDKYIASRACTVKEIRFDEDRFPKEIQFDKDTYYAILIDKLKKGLIKIPLAPESYEESSWLMQHCSNLDTKIKIINGMPKQTFIKAGETDGFAALLNAVIGLQFLVTDKFTQKDLRGFALNGNVKSKNTAPVIGTFAKRFF